MVKYKLEFTKKAKEDIKIIKKQNKILYNKINKFLEELKDNPKTGTGKPEFLKYRKCWSRRIDKEHRLVYKIQDEVVVVLVLSAFGHYDDE